jgi:hypothetical protein
MNTITRLKSNRGGEKAVDSGFVYNFDKKIENNIRWRCCHRSCKGAIITNEGDVIIKVVTHTIDQSDPVNVRKNVLINEIKEKTKSTGHKSSDVLIDVLSKEDDDVICRLPKMKTIQDGITKRRLVETGFKLDTYSDIPEHLKLTLCGKNFVLYDSGFDDTNRIIIFCSDFFLDKTKRCKIFGMDGTFKSVPREFEQLYSIHFYQLGKFFPAFFILMKNKLKASYIMVFNKIRETCMLSPSIVVVDFEIGVVSALNQVFPECQVNGCVFHFSQSIWRKLQSFVY